MKPRVTDRKYVKVDAGGNIKAPRNFNNEFYVEIDQEKWRVCKLFFINTFDISERVIRTTLAKKTGAEGLAMLPDLRDKHKNQKQLPTDIKNSIRDLIR